jgi:hypothetical protein
LPDLASAVDEDGRGAPVDVAPGQRDGLADTEARTDEDLGEWPVRSRAGVEVGGDLVAAEVVHLAMLRRQNDSGSPAAGGGVRHDESIFDGVGERDAKDRDGVVDRLGSEVALRRQIGHQTPDLLGCQVAQPDSSERWLESQPDIDLVRPVRVVLDACPVLDEPAVEILAKRLARLGADPATVDSRQLAGEKALGCRLVARVLRACRRRPSGLGTSYRTSYTVTPSPRLRGVIVPLATTTTVLDRR